MLTNIAPYATPLGTYIVTLAGAAVQVNGGGGSVLPAPANYAPSYYKRSTKYTNNSGGNIYLGPDSGVSATNYEEVLAPGQMVEIQANGSANLYAFGTGNLKVVEYQ